jgi:hypothetical protein
LTAGEAKNVDNAVVLARLFNEASGQKAPSKKHGLFISRSLVAARLIFWNTELHGGSTELPSLDGRWSVFQRNYIDIGDLR